MKDIFRFKKIIDLSFSKRAAFAAVAAVIAVAAPAALLYLRRKP